MISGQAIRSASARAAVRSRIKIDKSFVALDPRKPGAWRSSTRSRGSATVSTCRPPPRNEDLRSRNALCDRMCHGSGLSLRSPQRRAGPPDARRKRLLAHQPDKEFFGHCAILSPASLTDRADRPAPARSTRAKEIADFMSLIDRTHAICPASGCARGRSRRRQSGLPPQYRRKSET